MGGLPGGDAHPYPELSSRALAVHAMDEGAKRHYEQFDFVASPTDPLHLFVLLKDIRKLLEDR